MQSDKIKREQRCLSLKSGGGGGSLESLVLGVLREAKSVDGVASVEETTSSGTFGPSSALEYLERQSASHLLGANELLVLLKMYEIVRKVWRLKIEYQ